MINKTSFLCKITKKEFIERLRVNSKENLELISLVEKYFLKKRGYVFKMPKKGDSVVLMVSGGLDSTIVWGILLEVYGYKVYPVYINRGLRKSRKELRVVKYFDKYFRKKFPDLSQKFFVLSAKLPPPEVKVEFAQKYPHLYFNREILLNKVMDAQFSLPAATELTFVYPIYGVVYSDYLKFRFNIDVKNIFNGVLPTDGIGIPSQSFTSLRTTLLMMCVSTDCYDWNFASFTFEKEVGHFIDKNRLVAIGKKLKLPLYKTWSCNSSGMLQCGDNCCSCFSRINSFKVNGYVDKTLYKKDLFVLLDKIKSKLYRCLYEKNNLSENKES